MVGKLVVNVGGMFSGKSTELLRQGERHTLAGNSVIYIKPSLDTRYSNSEIVTHRGNKVRAITVAGDLFSVMDKLTTDVVLIDEAQFFAYSVVADIMQLVSRGVQVYVSGLDMDFTGKGFGVIKELMARADEVKKFHAVCEGCGKDAVFTGKRVEQGTTETVQLGAKELYTPLCRECYRKAKEAGMIC